MIFSRFLVSSVAIAVLASVSGAHAQQVADNGSNFADGILVTTHDVTTCPYRVIGSVSTSASIEFSATNQASLFAKLRKKAKKLGAHAVILVTLSEPRMTAFSFSKRDAIGRAIQYVDPSCAPTK